MGPTTASLLSRYVQPSSLAEIGSGRPIQKLLGPLAAESMIAVSGMNGTDPRAIHRRAACQFVDDRLSPAAKLTFVHELLRRDMKEVRMFLERIEGLFASWPESERQSRAFSRALADIAGDRAVRVIADLLARDSIGAAEEGLACALNTDRALDQERYRMALPTARSERAARASARAMSDQAIAR